MVCFQLTSGVCDRSTQKPDVVYRRKCPIRV